MIHIQNLISFRLEYPLVKSQHFLNHSFVSIVSDGCKDVTDNILRENKNMNTFSESEYGKSNY